MGIIEEIIEDGHPEAEAGRPKSQFHEGATVQLHSLAAAPQYNGVNGELGFFSEDTGRWEVTMTGTGHKVKVKEDNMTFVRAKRAFCFAPRRSAAASDGGDAGLAAQVEKVDLQSTSNEAQKAISDELLQDAFEQVIGALGPELRIKLGYVEDAQSGAEESANDRVDAAVGETLEPLLNGIEAASKTCTSEAAFTETVNNLIRDYFLKSSAGCQATLASRRRDLDAQFRSENTAFSQIKDDLSPKLRDRLGFVQAPASETERAANARVEAAVEEILRPLLDVIQEAAATSASAAEFRDTANQLTRKYFTDASSPGCAARLAARRKELEDEGKRG